MSDSKNENDSTYPDPTAPSSGNANPYPERPASAEQDDRELRAQLQQSLQSDHEEHHESPFVGGHSGHAFGGTASEYFLAQLDMHHAAHKAQMNMRQQGDKSSVAGPSRPKNVQSVQDDDGGDEPAKKKTKVTRACDECRRKKIKCDAQGDTPDAPKCSNCQRTNAECLFTKAPQKRGPSRGYIRDLAERVNVLESERVTGGAIGGGVIGGGAGHRRSFSEFEAGQRTLSTPTQRRHPLLNNTIDPPEMAPATREITEDEGSVIQAYMQAVSRQNYGSFFRTETECRDLVSAASTRSRDVFFHVMAAIIAFEHGNSDELSFAYNSVLVIAGGNPDIYPILDNLLNLVSITQILLLVSYWGSPKQQGASGQVAALGALFGTAVDTAGSLKIHTFGKTPAEDTMESVLTFYVGRRCLWIVAFVDGLESFGYRKMRLTVPDELNALIMGDAQVFGQKNLPIISMTKILLPFVSETRDNVRENERVDAAYKAADNHLQTVGAMIVADFELTLPTVACMALSIVAHQGIYPHAKEECVDICNSLIEKLIYGPDVPLAHHFVAIATRYAIEAADFKKTKVEAVGVLKKVTEAIHKTDILKHNAFKTLILKKAEEKLDSLGGLQDLANTAVQAIEEDHNEEGKDWRKIFMDGHLKYFT